MGGVWHACADYATAEALRSIGQAQRTVRLVRVRVKVRVRVRVRAGPTHGAPTPTVALHDGGTTYCLPPTTHLEWLHLPNAPTLTMAILTVAPLTYGLKCDLLRVAIPTCLARPIYSLQ